MTEPSTIRGRRYYCPRCFHLGHEEPCSKCDFSNTGNEDPLLLEYPLRISKRHVLGIPIGRGEFSAIYLAFDSVAKHLLVAKEYLPWTMVSRPDGRTLVPYPDQEEEFTVGLKVFQEEGSILQRLRHHEDIVRFRASVSKHATAYLLMDYCGPKSLESRLRENNGPLCQTEALDLFGPILDALDASHRKHIMHCDINLRNIHVRDASRSVLLDFGSAQFAQDTGKPLRPITINPGYSAPEQHAGDIKSYGAWTDVYACSASLYHLTTGVPPVQADIRQKSDTLRPPKEIVSALTDSFSSAIVRGLSLDIYDRPQSIAEFRSLLYESSNQGTSARSIRVSGSATNKLISIARQIQSWVMPAMICILLGVFLWFLFFKPASDPGARFGETADTYTVSSLDYYILRDVSGSANRDEYDAVERIVLSTARPRDTSDPDYLGYAHFAAYVTNGFSSLEPATQHPDTVKRIKAKLRSWKGPSSFYARTNFSEVFARTLTAIRSGGKERDALVFILTDGVPDNTGHEVVCIGARDSFADFFDKATRDSLTSLMSEDRIHVTLAVLGRRPECESGIVRQWVALRSLLKQDNQIKLTILPLGGCTDTAEIEKKVLHAMKPLRRAPTVTMRFATNRLSDDQRQHFDRGDEFSAEVIFQAHLVDGAEVIVPEADVIDMRNNEVSELKVVNRSGGKSRVVSDRASYPVSSGVNRDQIGKKERLFFQPPIGFKLRAGEKYRIRLVRELARGSTTDTEMKPADDLLVDLGPSARVSKVRAGRLLGAVGLTVVLAAVMIVWLIRYIRLPKAPSKERLVIRFLILKPIRWWISGFTVGGIFLLILGLSLLVEISLVSWIVGIASLVVAVGSAVILFWQPVDHLVRGPSKLEMLLFILDTILIPAISGILILWA